VFGFFVQASPAKLGTPLVVGFCYVLLMCYQVAPCCSDQGADLGQHVRGLDKYMTDVVGKLSLKFFDPTTRFIFSSSSRLGEYVCTCHLVMTVLIFSQLRWGLVSS
jgi:hypothetical protein